MKKQVALALAAALSLSVAGTALAAPANPFVDVPANHWAYDALAQLQKAGVVSGYGDGTFRGDRTLTRYEMAAMIAKITVVDDKNAPLIKRLQSEFASELYNLGVRVDNLEKNASTIKFTGDARIRYQRGTGVAESIFEPASNDGHSSRWQSRVRLYMSSQINDNITFSGRIVGTNTTNARYTNQSGGAADNTAFGTSANNTLSFDKMEFAWKNGNWGVSAGRMLPKLGQGIFAWNDRVDGFIGSYSNGKFSAIAAVIDASLEAKLVDAGFLADEQTLNTTIGQLGYQVNDKIGVTAMYANVHNDMGILKPWAFGANFGLSDNLKLEGEYIYNTGNVVQLGFGDLNKKGYFARLTYGAAKMNTPGSFEVYGEYIRFGLGSGAVAVNSSKFDAAASLIGKRGWGAGFTYVLGKNHNMQLFYHDLKNSETGDKLKKQYTIATNFNF